MSPTAAAEEDGSQNVKKRRISTDTTLPSDQPKKARGRPRVEPDDGSAADRRRTQIRLAQRAYRARAENKKASLEEKANKYQGAIDEMQTVLKNFHASAISAGLATANPQLAHELELTVQDFDRLVAETKKQEDNETPDVDGKHSSHGSNSPPRATEAGIVARGSLSDGARPTALHTSDTTSSDSIPTSARVWPYGSSYDSTHSETHPLGVIAPVVPGGMGSSYADPVAQEFSRLRLPANLYGTRPDLLLQSPTTLELRAPMTYSSMETSFARRLHRAALEKAAYLLDQPQIREELVKQMFRISYRYINFPDIRRQLHERIARNSTEPLESFFDFPYRDFGGAGKHYTNTNLSGPSIASVPRPIGPARPLLKLDQNFHSRDPADDIAGIEGEWFNPDDVERYLYEERGITIRGMASYVEAELLLESPDLSGLPSTTTPAFAGDMMNAPGVYQSVDMRDGTFLSGDELDTTPRFNLSRAAGIVKTEPALVGNVHTPMPDGITGTRLSKRKVTIDVDRLVDEIAGCGVCLGRFPGFRRNDVERALQVSITSSPRFEEVY